MARRSDELRGQLIAEVVTSNQIVESAIRSDRHALSDKEQLLEIMKDVFRKIGRNTAAGKQATK